MPVQVPREVVAVFGSETRVRVLAALAGAFYPMTAYRAAKVGEVAMSKAYAEINRLAESGVIRQRGRGWVIEDPDLRNLLRKRIPLIWWDDFYAEKKRTLQHTEQILARAMARPLRPAAKDWRPVSEFRRDPMKDRILLRAGLRPSNHD